MSKFFYSAKNDSTGGTSSTTTTTGSSDSTTSSGTGTGGSQGTGPHPKRTLEIILLFIILGLVAYNTYMVSQDHKLVQSQQLTR